MARLMFRPCPFCGGLYVRFCDKTFYTENHEPEKVFWLMCRKCGATSGEYPSREKAAKHWNRRWE